MKKELFFLFALVLLSPLVISQSHRIEILIIPEDKIVSVGEPIQIRVNILDESNNPIEGSILMKLEDLREDLILEKTIKSNVFEEIRIPENVLAGEGKIIANYQGTEVSESFFVNRNIKASFKIEGEELVVTNIGNTIYDKQIYITIGETTGAKSPSLRIGESVSYRLVAPEGVYNVRATDGVETLTQGGVRLTGTGQVIGAIDKSSVPSMGITGGLKTDDETPISLSGSKFVYVFIATVFGAMILLTIERQYRRKTIKN